MQPPTLSNLNSNDKKPEQNQSGPNQSPQNNQNGNPENVESILTGLEKDLTNWSALNDELFNTALNAWAKSNNEKDKEKATQGIFKYFQNARRGLEEIKNKIPHQNQGKNQSKSSRASSFSKDIQDKISNLNSAQSNMKARESDLMQAKMDALPENILKKNIEEVKKIDTDLGKSIKEVINIYSKIEARKKTGVKLSDSEKLAFEQDLSEVKSVFDNNNELFSEFEKSVSAHSSSSESVVLAGFSDKVKSKLGRPNNNENVKDNSFIFYYDKARNSLDKSVDESPEKFKKVEESLSFVNAGFAKIKKEIESRKGKDSKLKDEDKLEIKRMIVENDEKFQAAYSDFVEVCISLNIDITHINESNQTINFKDRDSSSRIFINPEQDLTPKQELKVFELVRSFNYATGYGYKILDNIDDVKHMTAKEQRENAKGISDRIRIIDKQVSEDVDKLSVGKKLSADQKEGHKVLLDVEIVNLKEAQDELDALEDVPENQPTRNLVESILIRAENRIQELSDKLEKIRVATEKEVIEKLDAAEKEIEKIEENIRDINRKDAEGRNTLKVEKQERKDANSNDQTLGVFRKSMKSLFSPNPSYSNGQTYHTQRNISDTMADPKIYVKEAKDWIADMPESSDKEIKTKTKLLKKARRMNRRITSAKWRHYMTLDANEKGWYLGDKVGTAIVGKIGDGLDRIFG